MSGRFLYCQNTSCGAYLGSLGGNSCPLCGWCAGRAEDDVSRGLYFALCVCNSDKPERGTLRTGERGDSDSPAQALKQSPDRNVGAFNQRFSHVIKMHTWVSFYLAQQE